MTRCKLCDSAEARISVSLEFSGSSVNLAFCPDCARKFEMDVGALERKGLPEFLGRCKAFSETLTERDSCGLTCPNCRLAADDVAETGKVGCAFCYIVFRDLPIRKGGEVDQRLDALVAEECECHRESPEILERMLQAAVSEEDYEQAARIRDKLRDADASADNS